MSKKRKRFNTDVEDAEEDFHPNSFPSEILPRLWAMRTLVESWARVTTSLADHLRTIETLAKIDALAPGMGSDEIITKMRQHARDGPVFTLCSALRCLGMTLADERRLRMAVLGFEVNLPHLNLFDTLPNEIIQHVFSMIEQRDLPNVALVCRRFALICQGHERPTITIRRRFVTAVVLSRVSQYQPVRLTLTGRESSELFLEGMKQLSLFSTLRHLKITHCAEDADMPFIAGLTQLQSLELFRCTMLSGDEISHHLTALQGLKTLRMSRCNLRDAHVLSLCRAIPDLTELDLHWNNQLTDAVTAGLPTGLRRLGLRLTDTTGKGIEGLSGLTQLQELGLNSCNGITSTGTACLTRLFDLHKLYIGGFGYGNQTTDAIVPLLFKLTGLQRLGLSDMAVTDAGISHLTVLTNLEELWLNRCAAVTKAGVAPLLAGGVHVSHR